MTLTARICSRKRLILPLLLATALLAPFTSKAFAQNNTGRIYIVSHVDVLPKFAADTAKALVVYVADSRKDAGSVRIEVLVENGPNHFTLVEVWESRAAWEAHVTQDHTRQFRDKLFPWLGSPYDERVNYEVKP